MKHVNELIVDPGYGFPLNVLSIRSRNAMLTGYGDTSSIFHFGGVGVAFDTPVYIMSGLNFQAYGQALDFNGATVSNVNSVHATGATGHMLATVDYNAYPDLDSQGFIVKSTNLHSGANNNWAYQYFDNTDSANPVRKFGVNSDGDTYANTFKKNDGTEVSYSGHTHTKSQITDFPSLATVATTGSYNDLKDKPVISAGGKKCARFIIGTSGSGWTANDCDYLCDGVGDQTEINNAITALPTNGGEIIILDGTYNLSSGIIINKNNVKIKGSGRSTRIVLATAYAAVFGATGYTGITISDLTLDGLAYTNYVDGIKIDGSTFPKNCMFCNIMFKNLRYGVQIYKNTGDNVRDYDDMLSCVVTSNIFESCSYGAYIDGIEAAGCVISNNTFKNVVSNGICISEAEECIVSNNTMVFNGSGSGITLANACKNNNIIGNIIRNANKGINILTNGDPISCNNICGNNIMRGTGLTTDYTATQYTIYFDGATAINNLITGNMLKGKDVANNTGTGNIMANNMV